MFARLCLAAVLSHRYRNECADAERLGRAFPRGAWERVRVWGRVTTHELRDFVSGVHYTETVGGP